MKFQSHPPGHGQPELTECDREAIHQIGFVQSFGALIAVDRDWSITHLSANIGAILGGDNTFQAGQALSDHFTSQAVETLRESLGRIVEDDTTERVFGIKLTTSDTLFDCSIHPSGPHIIISGR